ncbi:hypothetical protein HKD37_04G010046 [Glycine soja]
MLMSFVVRWKEELVHTWYLLHSSSNMHSVTYNQDLLYYELTENHQVTLTHFGQSIFLLTIFKSRSEPKDVLNIMYSFIKVVRVTHLNLEGTTECRIVYNHWRKTTKIGNG